MDENYPYATRPAGLGLRNPNPVQLDSLQVNLSESCQDVGAPYSLYFPYLKMAPRVLPGSAGRHLFSPPPPSTLIMFSNCMSSLQCPRTRLPHGLPPSRNSPEDLVILPMSSVLVIHELEQGRPTYLSLHPRAANPRDYSTHRGSPTPAPLPPLPLQYILQLFRLFLLQLVRL